MQKVFGKDPVTSSEFPRVIFAARGLLMHEFPALSQFAESYFQKTLSATKPVPSLKEIESQLVSLTRELNQSSEGNPSFSLEEAWVFKSLLEVYAGEATEQALAEFRVAYEGTVKWVIPEGSIEVLEELKRRGYRLAVASNADHRLNDLFRLQGLLGLFDFVLTADDLGARKPSIEFFQEVESEIPETAGESVFVGASYLADISGAKRLGFQSVLYDPKQWQLRALASSTETSGKVVSLEQLRQNRHLEEVKVITKFEELLEFFK